MLNVPTPDSRCLKNKTGPTPEDWALLVCVPSWERTGVVERSRAGWRLPARVNHAEVIRHLHSSIPTPPSQADIPAMTPGRSVC